MTKHTVRLGSTDYRTPESLVVVNPSTGEEFGAAPDCDPALVKPAVAAAQAAFATWSLDPQARTDAMLACAEALKNAAPELGALMAREMGKPLPKAIQEAFIAGFIFEGNASLPIDAEVLAEAPSAVTVRRRPYGVVAAIAPWNWPLGLAMWKVLPALRMGNTVILKPSPFAPLTALKAAELLQGLLPPGVFTVLTGGDELGAALVAHPKVRKVGFTGSVKVGLAIAQSCAQDLTRCTLEMGGNDAAVVLADADVEAVTEALFWGAFQNSGQVCSAIKRLYVAQEIFDDVVARLTARANRTVVGDPFDEGTEMGPIGNRRQLDRVESLLSSARDDGATIDCGGVRLDGEGLFMRPTIVTGLSDASALVAEEQFGPVLPVMPIASAEEGIERANATSFGLGGSVWTSDVARGTELASRLQVGTAWVNQHFVLDSSSPFGGCKTSWQGPIE